MRKMILQCSALALGLWAANLMAAVSPQEAAKLGTSLTPVGAEKAGNADGSIPAWTGGIPKNAGAVDSKGFLADPFANEKPLFIITAATVDKYKDKLSDGQVAMFKRYPDSYRIPVYPTHRSVGLPPEIYESAKRSALSVTTTNDGNGLANFTGNRYYAFPIPKNGIEVLWNHLTRYHGGNQKRIVTQVTPQTNGSYTSIRFEEEVAAPQLIPDLDPAKAANVQNFFKQSVTAPARLAGNVLLVHETLDQVKEPRSAWIYNAGQRRVRRAPQVAYDGPGTAADGLRTSDFQRQRLGVDHQIGIERHVIGEGLARDVIPAGRVQALRITLGAHRRRCLDVDRQQTLLADQVLGLLAPFGTRCHERRQGQQPGFVELTGHMGRAPPVLGTPGTVLGQALVQVMPQVLAIEHIHRAPHVEQLALDRVGQGALARTRQAAEQHGSRLLAETLGTLFGGYMSQLAVLGDAAMGHRLGDDHAGADGAVGQAVDDDESTGGAIAFVTIQGNRRVEADLDLADLVQLQRAGRALFQGVHIDLVMDAGNRARHIAGGALDVVLLARQHRLFGHPYQHGFEAVGDRRHVVGMHQQVAAGDIDFIFHGQGHGLARAGLLQFTFEGDNGLDPAALARRQHDDLVALVHDAAGQGAGKTTEVQVRTVDILHRETQVGEVAVAGHFHGLEDFHQRLAGVPGRALALVHHVVALERRHRHEVQAGGLQLQALGELQVVGLDRFEHAFIEVLEVHLVDGHDDVLDAQQGGDEAVATGLGLYAVAGVHQDDRQVTGGCTGGHVAGVLLMAGGVGDDELALGGGEIAVGDIDGDALLTLGLQAVDQQRQVDVVTGGADLLRVPGDGFQMVFVDHLRVVQQAPDQGALAVVDVTAGQKAQQLLAFVLAQVREDVLADQIRLMRHDSPLEITLTFLVFH